MHDTLSPSPPLPVTALPTAFPTSGQRADFLALLLDTGAQHAWPGSMLAPSAVPTACVLHALPLPIGQAPPGPASLDLDAAPPETGALPVHPERVHALADNLFLQTGPGRYCSDRQETRQASQNSAGVTRLHSAHNARSLAVRLGLSVPFRAAPLDSSSCSRVIEPDSP